MKILYFDTEYVARAEKFVKPICLAALWAEDSKLQGRAEFWLYDNDGAEAKKFVEDKIAEGYLLCSYSNEAEASALLALGFAGEYLTKAPWLDLFLEYKCLLNQNNELSYGDQYVNGRVVKMHPPRGKWESKEADGKTRGKPNNSLTSACFKLLGVKIDAEQKTQMRQICIDGDPEQILANKEEILAYCVSDVTHLPDLLRATYEYFVKKKGFSGKKWLEEAKLRGDYAVRSARMVSLGYPINVERVRKFTAAVPQILKGAAEICLAKAPEVEAFVWNKKAQRYSQKQKNIRAWIAAQNKPHWEMTDGGAPSLSRQAFGKWYAKDSPGFGGAYCQYSSVEQALYGFSPGGKGKKFAEFVGSDGRARPYFNIYGSQTARSQPGANGYLFLKSHWMRIFIEAPKGRAIAGADYSSQEFALAAILSQDSPMMRAYESGDVYLAFGKEASMIPRSGTKQTHKKERNLCKALVLGISYDMSPKGLAPRLTEISGVTWTETQAEALINKFYGVYSNYFEWKKAIQREYQACRRLKLPDGWTMWGGNPSHRSIGNFPTQGLGSCIMREAVRRAQDAGLDVCATLHDALYIEYDAYDFRAISELKRHMSEAFDALVKPIGKSTPIRIDASTWSRDYEGWVGSTDVAEVMSEYSDEDSEEDIARHKQYFI